MLKESALYICYFGLREPLVQTQVLPYIRQLRDAGVKMSILTFEPERANAPGAGEIELFKKSLADEGIEWHFLKYHKTPSVPATIFDILNGARFIRKFIGTSNPDILHCRVHTPALMAAIAKRLTRKPTKLLFDIRGFFPEEYTDAGRWKENGLLYKAVKRIEKWLLKESDGFVVLTEKAREILFPESKGTGFDKRGRPVEVIPCCVDLERFKDANEESRKRFREEFELGDRKVIAYVGSFGGWYLTQETADFFAVAKREDQDVFALILTQSDPNEIELLLKERGFGAGDFLVAKVKPDEIPYYLSGSDMALSFIKPCYSKQASSPTKNAEYLACGLPIVVNDGVGDTARMTIDDDVGVVIDSFTNEAYADALKKIEEMSQDQAALSARCRKSAEKRFDLNSVGGFRYKNLYERLLDNDYFPKG